MASIGIQLFSGGFLGNSIPYEIVEQKLIFILSKLPVDKVIMGWSGDKFLYEKTAKFLEKRNIEFYLWFPVFSETGALKNLNPLLDYQGRKLVSEKVHGEENFAFCCPTDTQNIEMILKIFEQEFASIPFTGVFLDKIRYPSFAQSRRGVFSCFCPKCLEKFNKNNFDFDGFKASYSNQNHIPLNIRGYHGNGNYEFEDPNISQFFSLKGKFIYQSIKSICGYFKEKNYKIGLDVFAPFLSTFVGQDLVSLSRLCDFLKPMMYRITHAPAGMPFELNALLQEKSERQGFCKILGIGAENGIFNLDFTIKELSNLKQISQCSISAGIEINRKKNIAEVYPEYIEETMEAYVRTGIQGLILSWDLLDAPPENIVKVGEMMGR